MHLSKIKTSKGRFYLTNVNYYYDEKRKISRSKKIEPLGYLDELEKLYANPVTHFQNRVN